MHNFGGMLPIQDTSVEVLDEDSCSRGSSSLSLQAMASAPLLGRTVCASCNEEIVDKYLLKVKYNRPTHRKSAFIGVMIPWFIILLKRLVI